MIKATYNDKSAVVDILYQSFEANISVNYVVKQDKHRERRIRLLMEYSFDICHMFGAIYLSGDRNACALTLHPDQKRTTLKSVLLDAKMAFGCVGLTRVYRVLNRETKIKKAYPEQPLLYLWFIGVKRAKQNRGIGGALLDEVIKESNAIQRPIYLETSMLENVSFYKKFGFEIYKELDFGHTLFLLRRELS